MTFESTQHTIKTEGKMMSAARHEELETARCLFDQGGYS